MEFLEHHELELSARPVWIFSSGPTGEGDPLTLMKGWNFPEAQRSIADRICPRGITVFHGDFEPEKMSLGERLLVRVIRAPVGDFRDWDAIRDWAFTIADELAPVPEV